MKSMQHLDKFQIRETITPGKMFFICISPLHETAIRTLVKSLFGNSTENRDPIPANECHMPGIHGQIAAALHADDKIPISMLLDEFLEVMEERPGRGALDEGVERLLFKEIILRSWWLSPDHGATVGIVHPRERNAIADDSRPTLAILGHREADLLPLAG